MRQTLVPITFQEATQLYINILVLASNQQHWAVNGFLHRDIEETSAAEAYVRRSSRVQVVVGRSRGRPGVNGGTRPVSLPKNLVLESLKRVEDAVAGVMFEHPERIRLGSIYIETSIRILGEIRLELGEGSRHQDDVGTEA